MASNTDGDRILSPQGDWITRREAEVLGLIAQGLSSMDVADSLFLSKRTVDFHLANVYEKLGVANRVQAILAAESRGMLPEGPGGGNVVDLRGELREALSTSRSAVPATSQGHLDSSYRVPEVQDRSPDALAMQTLRDPAAGPPPRWPARHR